MGGGGKLGLVRRSLNYSCLIVYSLPPDNHMKAVLRRKRPIRGSGCGCGWGRGSAYV